MATHALMGAALSRLLGRSKSTCHPDEPKPVNLPDRSKPARHPDEPKPSHLLDRSKPSCLSGGKKPAHLPDRSKPSRLSGGKKPARLPGESTSNRSRSLAFLVGVASHATGDALPHREHPPAVDGPLTAAVLLLLARRYGIDSPEMAGALGGIVPDAEHLPTRLGWFPDTAELYPTHGPYPQPLLHSMGITPQGDRLQIALALTALTLLRKVRKDE